MESAPAGADAALVIYQQQQFPPPPILHSQSRQQQIGERECAPTSEEKEKEKEKEKEEQKKKDKNKKKKEQKKKKKANKSNTRGEIAEDLLSDDAVLPCVQQQQMGDGDKEKEQKNKKKKNKKNLGGGDDGVQQQTCQGQGEGGKDQEKNKKRKQMEAAVDNNQNQKKTAKSKLCERFFSQQDEIDILQGLIALKNQKKKPIPSHLNLSLSVEPKPQQLCDKISKLKHKYYKAKNKAQLLHFADDQDAQIYALSHALWNPNHNDGGASSSSGTKTKNASSSNNGVVTCCTGKCHEIEEINITSLPQLLGELKKNGLSGGLHADLESKTKDELIHYIQAHMFRLTTAQKQTASFLATLELP